MLVLISAFVWVRAYAYSCAHVWVVLCRVVLIREGKVEIGWQALNLNNHSIIAHESCKVFHTSFQADGASRSPFS